MRVQWLSSRPQWDGTEGPGGRRCDPLARHPDHTLQKSPCQPITGVVGIRNCLCCGQRRQLGTLVPGVFVPTGMAMMYAEAGGPSLFLVLQDAYLGD